MRKIIDGKVYDTDTATELASASYGYRSDFRWFSETLYITKKGAFFLAGEGGGLSRWRRTVEQNSWTEGSGMVALSEREALDWCEQHSIDPSVIEDHAKVEEA